MPRTMIIAKCHLCTRVQEWRGEHYKTIRQEIAKWGWRMSVVDRHRERWTCPNHGSTHADDSRPAAGD
jgi:hypothetical protein